MTATVVEYDFDADPAVVYRAWTQPEEVTRWFGHRAPALASASIDLRVGGAWCFILSASPEGSFGFAGEYLEIVADRRLCFTWARVAIRPGGERESSLPAVVEVDFTPRAGGTHVRLVHTQRRPGDSTEGVGAGWSYSLDALRRQLTD